MTASSVGFRLSSQTRSSSTRAWRSLRKRSSLRPEHETQMGIQESHPAAGRNALARAMTFKDYLALGVGAIIGVGWVVVSGDWLARGGPLGATIGFFIGGVLVVFRGAFSAR